MTDYSIEKYWSDYYRKDRDFLSVTTQELQKILTYLSKTAPKTALDLGCGTGQLVRKLHKSGFKVTGVDISQAALKIARSATFTSANRISYKRGNIEKISFAELPFAPYGLIICQSVYAFIRNKERLLKEVKQTLVPDGTLVIISQLTDYVPQHKKISAIDPDNTITDLQKNFDVRYYEQAKIGYFICSPIKSAV